MSLKDKAIEVKDTVERYAGKARDLGNALTGRTQARKIRQYIKDTARKTRSR